MRFRDLESFKQYCMKEGRQSGLGVAFYDLEGAAKRFVRIKAALAFVGKLDARALRPAKEQFLKVRVQVYAICERENITPPSLSPLAFANWLLK